MSTEPQVIMGPIIQNAVNAPSPCELVLGPNEYRRTLWENYNPSKTPGVFPPTFTSGMTPDNGWETEIRNKYDRVYDIYPFSSLPSYYVPPSSNPTDSQQCSITGGVWCEKIKHCFDSQQDLEDYVASIGSTYYSNSITGGWYGADISLSNLYINPSLELPMYKAENSGGLYSDGNIYSDERLLQYDVAYSADSNGNSISTNLEGLYAIDVIGGRGSNRNSQITKAVINDSSSGKCYVFSIALGTPTGNEGDLPPLPSPTPAPVVVPILTMPNAETYSGNNSVCIPIPFPYASLPSAVLEGIGQSMFTTIDQSSIDMSLFTSFEFPGLGVPEYPDETFGETMNRYLGDAMNEAKQFAISLPTAIRTAVINALKAQVEPILSLIGGAWDLIKSLVPPITILGVEIDLIYLVFEAENPVQYLSNAFYQIIDNGTQKIEDVITAIYQAIGSAYDYANELYTSPRKDLNDSLQTLWDWIVMKVEMGYVGLMGYLGELAEIFTIPPPLNPINLAIRAVNQIFNTVYDGLLAKIVSGEFPGFTAMDIYDLMMEQVNTIIEQVNAQITVLLDQLEAIKNQIANLGPQLQELQLQIEQGVKQGVDDAEEQYEQLVAQYDALKAQLDSYMNQESDTQSTIDSLLDSISDKWELLLAYVNDLPIMATINDLLSMMGLAADDLINLVENSYNQATAAASSFKDEVKQWCQTIMDQVATFCVTFVTEWVNRITSLLGFVLTFPTFTICIPIMPPINISFPAIPEIPDAPGVPALPSVPDTPSIPTVPEIPST